MTLSSNKGAECGYCWLEGPDSFGNYDLVVSGLCPYHGAGEDRIGRLCDAIQAFLNDPPPDAHEESVLALHQPLRMLRADAEHIERAA